MKWVHIHIEGIVQGVGFRPFVYKLANWLNIKGWVCNGVAGVQIEAGGSPEQIEMFKYLLTDDAPVESNITHFYSEDIAERNAEDFQIVESDSTGSPTLLITPDLGLCDHCRAEISNSQNSRYNYPFTTCTRCGPRYSILKALPYDRPLTTMDEFKMCENCKQEYNNPYDRRHFSQTNSCLACTIPVRLLDNQGIELASTWNEALNELVRKLEAGKIAAVKGIGGYMLMVDATNESAITKLRERKHRPTKPFAVMYPNLEMLKHDAELSQAETDALRSIQSPIVLTKAKRNPRSAICFSEIAPGLDRIGAMLPYTALFELLLKAMGKPLVATSGNASGSPILFKDENAFNHLKDIADVFLTNEREIQVAQDDSVVRFTQANQRIVIRRSRGYAPNFINKSFSYSSECVLAMGADMKSSFALQVNGRAYTSQYLGNLESYESQESFRTTLDHLLNMLRAQPERIVVDAHPNYFSSVLGRQLAQQWNIPVEQVQHHKAHAYAVLTENEKLQTALPTLCVVWDGTGYGEDKQSWGGEFFLYDEQHLERLTHFKYFPAWQGDLMAHQPRLAALFLCKDFLEVTNLKDHFSEKEWLFYSKLIQSNATHHTSSVGRLFDGVAALLNLCNHNSFEGEASMLLETLASTGHCKEHYKVTWCENTIDQQGVIKQIVSDIHNGISKSEIAFKFHVYLADVILEVAKKYKVQQVALSGGVFQNALLVDIIHEKMNSHYKIFCHHELSPNDENIAVGQLAFVEFDRKKEKQAELLIMNLN